MIIIIVGVRVLKPETRQKHTGAQASQETIGRPDPFFQDKYTHPSSLLEIRTVSTPGYTLGTI